MNYLVKNLMKNTIGALGVCVSGYDHVNHVVDQECAFYEF